MHITWDKNRAIHAMYYMYHLITRQFGLFQNVLLKRQEMCMDLRIKNVWWIVSQITVQRTSTNWTSTAPQYFGVIQVTMRKFAHCWITIVVTRILH